ncbi:hypothetical protein DSM25559_3242 [Agrobacterium rosae]|uniref:Uncharacterized protein n=1 Tax=Agrobacterium rosae TaxID=1972867 RepID=A0A1R3TWK4_9HYPH|nr:hypothetical protein DSM25559_3242 [Agrobacterium rosae]
MFGGMYSVMGEGCRIYLSQRKCSCTKATYVAEELKCPPLCKVEMSN